MLIAALVVAYLLVGACVAGLAFRTSGGWDDVHTDGAFGVMVILLWPAVLSAALLGLPLALAAWIGRRRP